MSAKAMHIVLCSASVLAMAWGTWLGADAEHLGSTSSGWALFAGGACLGIFYAVFATSLLRRAPAGQERKEPSWMLGAGVLLVMAACAALVWWPLARRVLAT